MTAENRIAEIATSGPAGDSPLLLPPETPEANNCDPLYIRDVPVVDQTGQTHYSDRIGPAGIIDLRRQYGIGEDEVIPRYDSTLRAIYDSTQAINEVRRVHRRRRAISKHT